MQGNRTTDTASRGRVRRRRHFPGFTLLEIMITMCMFLVVFFAFLTLLQYGSAFTNDAEKRVMANHFARATMEQRCWGAPATLTGGWQADAALPTGVEFGSDLRDNHGATREYRVTSSTPAYQIMETRVRWSR